MVIAIQFDIAHDAATVSLDATIEIVQALAANGGNGQVEQLGGPRLVPRIQAADFPARYQVETAFENLDHLRDFERIVLQVAVQRRDVLAAGLGKAERQGGRLATVELEAVPVHKGIFLGKLFQDFPRVVAATVIDDDYLVLETRRRYSRDDFFQQFRKVFAFFLYRNDQA